MAHEKKFKREFAEKEALSVISKLDGLYKDLAICGSIRRGLAEVGDLDIVIVPVRNEDQESLLISSIKSLGEVLANGSKVIRIALPSKLQVDFYIAPERLLGAFKLFLTGSKDFNIKCRGTAKRFGHRLSQYGLIGENGEEVAVGELEILEALGMGEFSNPVTRSISFK
jgi:DNA polymerase/3'-5' exonuclease PolX